KKCSDTVRVSNPQAIGLLQFIGFYRKMSVFIAAAEYRFRGPTILNNQPPFACSQLKT
ncbi:hypothetical protein L9F63_025644, partial [Diploptera punctata]